MAVLSGVLLVMLLGAGAALAGTYFFGNSCCAHREFSGSYEYETSNAADNGGGYPQCVQEQVFPNWPSTSGAFFDTYKCHSGSVSHSLNGENVDRAVCWINAAPAPLNTCTEAP
ncbi:MAG: hypothetical protein ACRDMJ_12695 [Solirubrobacteraceae bacterium]